MSAKKQRKIGEIVNTNLILGELRKNNRIYYKVQCILCGSEREVRSDNLNQLCRSCAAKEVNKKTNRVTDDLTGRTFGYWKVLKKSKKSNYWFCECQNCGTQKDVFRGALTQGQSKSCGCVRSWGETQISYWLNQYNINYKKEYFFTDLKSPRGAYYRFDFAIFYNDNLFCLIEYDGRQHFNFDDNWRMSFEDYQYLQQADEKKNNYCILNNILLFRFNENTDLKKEIEKIYKDLTKGNK